MQCDRDPEIYWVAGFLEGEGCFGWYGENRKLPNRRKKWLGYPAVVVGQNDPEPLERLAATFPGTIRFNSFNRGGKEHYEYRVINESAIDIMVAVFPLMSVRRQEKIKEVVANYAERTVERIQDALFCPKGHSRDIYGFGYKGERRCRECQNIWAATGRARKQEASECPV